MTDQRRAQELVPISYLYLPGFLKNSRRVDDPKSVKHEKGLLEVQNAYVGSHTYRRKRMNDGSELEVKTEYRVWLHPDLPVGFAHACMTATMCVDEKENAAWELEYTLEAFGDDAQPSIVEESVPPAPTAFDSK